MLKGNARLCVPHVIGSAHLPIPPPWFPPVEGSGTGAHVDEVWATWVGVKRVWPAAGHPFRHRVGRGELCHRRDSAASGTATGSRRVFRGYTGPHRPLPRMLVRQRSIEKGHLHVLTFLAACAHDEDGLGCCNGSDLCILQSFTTRAPQSSGHHGLWRGLAPKKNLEVDFCTNISPPKYTCIHVMK
ncbi:hypothetical protein NDU88_008165 [Pleurodeles waltl]|uniref:Uncharacterized protein n=1 Tax=Pleurodeles waltl TaxID=8319 RepID=A0AAV7QMR0_PLEWA|nr:hypothetical protein NDU88_008165 [Pleurodeles waltl]